MTYKVTRVIGDIDIIVTITNAALVGVDTRNTNCFNFAIGDDSDISAIRRLHKRCDYSQYWDKPFDVKNIRGVSGNATSLTLTNFHTIDFFTL